MLKYNVFQSYILTFVWLTLDTQKQQIIHCSIK